MANINLRSIKLIICLLLLSFVFLSPPISHAETWYKYPNNPVFLPGSLDWEKDSVSSPAVIHENGQFKMWYQGLNGSVWSIGLAYSNDGINWIREPSNPVLTARTDFNEVGVEEPTVLKNDLYRMWYKADNGSVIRYAYSEDGIHWSRRSEVAINHTAGAWDAKAVANPFVLYKDGQYMMWYAGQATNKPWKLGLAYSTDGINWTKYANNPLQMPTLGHMGAPHVLFKDGIFHIFYHTGGDIPSDIFHATSTDGITWRCVDMCTMLRASPGGFDSWRIIGPSVIDINDNSYLFYAGTDHDIWKIGLATIQSIDNKTAIIVIPGLFSSWNKNALFYNQSVNQNDWQLNPIVHDYSGITQTLNNLGYEPNKDYYIFNYDWRKGLNDLADDFNNYFQALGASDPSRRFSLVGHSLGGLIARTYLQKYNSTHIDKIITVGSPHQGAVQAYKAVAAGEVETGNDLMWLAEKLIIHLNKNNIKTDREVIAERFPVAQDLLATFNFLRDKNNQDIEIRDMQVKNITLPNYQNNFSDIFPILKTIVGEKGETLSGYNVSEPNTLDKLLNLYPDGRPQSSFKEIGDYTVISRSAKAGNNIVVLPKDHAEIICCAEGIKSILDNLSIEYQDNQIVTGSKTKVTPSLIFLILSPAGLEVNFDNRTFLEQQGVVFIEDASAGTYELKATGKELGRYTILLGQLTTAGDQWTRIEGEISQTPPTAQIDTYHINFHPDSIAYSPVNIDRPSYLFGELILYLTDLNKTLSRTEITNAIKHLQQGQLYLSQNNYGRLKTNLLAIHQELAAVRKRENWENKTKLLYCLEKLENIYTASLTNYQTGIFPSRIKSELENYRKSLNTNQQYLLVNKNKGADVNRNSLIMLEIDKKLTQASLYFSQKKYNLTEILLKTVGELNKEIRQI